MEENPDKDQSVPRQILILYATETGTARETADRIARECRRVRFRCSVQSMDAYPPVSAFDTTQLSFVIRSLSGIINFGTPGHLCSLNHWLRR